VHARKTCGYPDIMFGRRDIEVVHPSDESRIRIDYGRFHEAFEGSRGGPDTLFIAASAFGFRTLVFLRIAAATTFPVSGAAAVLHFQFSPRWKQ
jgi:hypothetical protein